MEGSHKGKAGGAKAKATGQVSGEPDLRYYLPGGRLILVELKVAGGQLSPVQVKRHTVLRGLGFHISVIYADCPLDGWNQVRDELNNWGACLEEYYTGG